MHPHLGEVCPQGLEIAAEQRARTKVMTLTAIILMAMLATMVVLTIISRIRGLPKTDASPVAPQRIWALDLIYLVVSTVLVAILIFLYFFVDLAPNLRPPF
jgi:hypothetical protein